jgi:biotin operon repressor
MRIKKRQAHRTHSPKIAVREALSLLRALAADALSLEDLIAVVGRSRATVFRLLNDLRLELGVDIIFDESVGGYRVVDWGVLNRRRVC